MFLTKLVKVLQQQMNDLYVTSQSPQIGSMFLTGFFYALIFCFFYLVAIPSNRVNVSYSLANTKRRKNIIQSQSPQIGSMFLTMEYSQNSRPIWLCRNPLKSGQCFLQDFWRVDYDKVTGEIVAIPSNRVNVSY